MELNRIFVAGLGAVSPAGWGVPSLRAALEKGEPLPVQEVERPGRRKPLRLRRVPAPMTRPACFTNPRLRRASAVSQFAAAATFEAVAMLPEPLRAARFGLVFCFQSGPVQYASRFYEETLRDPATASPLLFPETVYAAPASHVAAVLGNTPLVCTLVGDAGAFAAGLALGADWLREDRVDVALVVGAEEFNWLHADAAWLFSHETIMSAGAGAICLARGTPSAAGVELQAISDAWTYAAGRTQAQAARRVREQLGPGATDELLCDSTGADRRASAAEAGAWQGWPGARLSPKRILGESLMAGGAWQVVAAADALGQGRFRAANISIVGCHQQAVGVRLSAVSLPRQHE